MIESWIFFVAMLCINAVTAILHQIMVVKPNAKTVALNRLEYFMWFSTVLFFISLLAVVTWGLPTYKTLAN